MLEILHEDGDLLVAEALALAGAPVLADVRLVLLADLGKMLLIISQLLLVANILLWRGYDLYLRLLVDFLGATLGYGTTGSAYLRH